MKDSHFYIIFRVLGKTITVMTTVDRLKEDIILAGEFLKNNPNWEPCWNLSDDHCRAIAEIVDELSSD